MRRQVECATLAVLLVALRAAPERLQWAAVQGVPVPARAVRAVALTCKALGMDVHELPYRLMLTAGSCDVEGPWRRVRAHTRAEHERMHRSTLFRFASEDRARAERRERVRLRAEKAMAQEDLADIAL